MLYILPIFSDTNYSKFSEGLVQYIAQACFKAQNGAKFGPPQAIRDHQEGLSCLTKPDDMLTKKVKYRYKIAIFYRFLAIPILTAGII